jgi:hypothetical protein
VSDLFDQDEVGKVLAGGFYSERPAPAAKVEEKPTHYKTLCISMYNEDIEALDAMVRALKARGHTKASRSALIRYAIAQVQVEGVPRRSLF